MVKKVHKEGSWRKKRKLRSRPKFDLVNKTMKEIYTTFGRELSQLTISELCHQHDVLYSSQTIHRVLSSPLWKFIKRPLAPTNTPQHCKARLDFCEKYYQALFGGKGNDVLWIDIDEKNFVSFIRKVVYIPQELEHTLKPLHVASKVPMQKVMFFGAVAKPRPNRDFDGKILLVSIC
jgi:hypothetical protein